MKRQPYRFLLKRPFPPMVLSFWTIQSTDMARGAAIYERDGQLEKAREYWSIARDGSPADVATKRFCDAHAKAFRLVGGDSLEPAGEPVDLVRFIEANADGFPPEELDQLRALPVGAQWKFGGGAAPFGYVERVA